MFNRCLLSILFLTLFPGLAQAVTEQIVNPSGSSDQNVINQALETVYNSGGGTVYLTSGVYNINAPVVIKSNIKFTGDPDAIIRVSSSSSQWFTGSNGIISCKESIKNVEISGFQIDGNLGSLPASFANTPGHDKDCERCILLGGYSNDYADNISIHDMKLYDSFSDGIYLRYTTGAHCYNNEISNTQHEGIYLSVALQSEIYSNQIAAITSDAARLDNCVNCKVYDNLFFSYDGDNLNGAYPHGENGLQIGDSGVSHGYDGRNKPTTTTDIEVFGNTFAANGLKAILLNSAALTESANVFIHDNKFIGKAELKTSGISFEISNSNPSTLERSEKTFSSIFDILNQDFSFQYQNIQVPINASVGITEYNNSYNPHSLICVSGEGLTGVKYEYAGLSSTHYFSINGESSDLWTGDLEHTGNAVYLNGSLDASKLHITCYNSQGYSRITDFNITEINDDSSQVLNPQLWAFVGTLVILGLYIYRNLRRVTRW